MRGSLLDELWKAHFIDRKVRLAFDSLLAEDNGPLIRAICQRATGVTRPEVRAALKRGKITIDFPVPKAAGPATAPPTAPKSGAAAAQKKAGKRDAETLAAMSEATLPNLIAAGLIKTPLDLERGYKGVKLVATIQPDGRVVFDGQSHDSLSTAGGMARKSVIGATPGRPYPQTNGWTFWQFRDLKTGDLEELDSLRQQFLESKK
jgi:hypothetical protein